MSFSRLTHSTHIGYPCAKTSTPTTHRVIGNSNAEGEPRRPKHLKESMSLTGISRGAGWGGGGGQLKKKFYEGKMIIFQSNALTLTTPNGLVLQNLDTQGKVQVWPM